MTHLLKLEIRKFRLPRKMIAAFLATAFCMLFITVSLADSMTDPEQTKDTFESTFLLTGLLVFFCGKSMTVLFVSENVREITEYVDISLRCAALSFVFLAVVNIYRNGIQGMGFGLLPMTAGIAELVGRSMAAVAASRFGSFLGICLASPVAWILAAGLLLVMYFRIMRQFKAKGMLEQGEAEAVPVLKKRYT